MTDSNSTKPTASFLFGLIDKTDLDIHEIEQHLLAADNINYLENGESLLHICAKRGYFDLIRLLRMLGIKADWKNKDGKKPSDLAKAWLESLPESEQTADDKKLLKILERAERNDKREEKKLEQHINEIYTPDLKKMLRLVEETHEKGEIIKQQEKVIKQLEATIKELKTLLADTNTNTNANKKHQAADAKEEMMESPSPIKIK